MTVDGQDQIDDENQLETIRAFEDAMDSEHYRYGCLFRRWARVNGWQEAFLAPLAR